MSKMIDLDGEPVVYCPGCEMLHQIFINGTRSINWQWNGNTEKPTFTPSLRVQFHRFGEPTVCHSFIRDGQWQFLSDCTHKLAGQTVDMPDIPDWA